jgi:hypothetical protein
LLLSCDGQTIQAGSSAVDYFNPFAWIGNAFPLQDAENVLINAARKVTLRYLLITFDVLTPI